MAKKKARVVEASEIYEVSDDGHFSELPIELSSNPLEDKWLDPSRLSGLLNFVTGKAAEVQHAWLSSLGNDEDLLYKLRQGHPDRPVPPAVCRDATKVMEYSRGLERYGGGVPGQENMEAAAFFAMKCGMAFQRMMLRIAETDISRHRRSASGARKIRRLVSEKLRRRRQAAVAAEIERQRQSGERVNYGNACAAVAKTEAEDCDERSIRNSTVNLWTARPRRD